MARLGRIFGAVVVALGVGAVVAPQAMAEPTMFAECSPLVDHKSADGQLTCSGFGSWVSTPGLIHPRVVRDSRCSERGAWAMGPSSESEVPTLQCRADASGTFRWIHSYPN